MTYKLRAECSHDVAEFIQKSHGQMKNFKMERDKLFPDVVFKFESDLPLNKIILTLRDIEDSHVMYQTVKPIKQYTGKRNYDLN